MAPPITISSNGMDSITSLLIVLGNFPLDRSAFPEQSTETILLREPCALILLHVSLRINVGTILLHSLPAMGEVAAWLEFQLLGAQNLLKCPPKAVMAQRIQNGVHS